MGDIEAAKRGPRVGDREGERSGAGELGRMMAWVGPAAERRKGKTAQYTSWSLEEFRSLSLN
jgi:hypothetical protein